MSQRRETGSAMIIAVVISIIVIGIGGAFLADTAFRTRAAHNSVEFDEAQMICDAVLEKVRRALYVYKSTGSYAWNQILFDHQGYSSDADQHYQTYESGKLGSDFIAYNTSYYATGINTANDAPLPTDPAHFLGALKPFGQGGFYVVIQDNDDGDADPLTDADNQLFVYVTAMLPDRTIRQTATLVQFQDPTYTPDSAVVVDGSILFHGNPGVTGSNGSVHGNGDVYLQGSPSFSQSVNSTGVIHEGSVPPPSGGFNEGVPYVSIPDIVPSQYLSMAAYLLQADGSVVDNSTGQSVGNGTGPGGWNGWTYNATNSEWSLSGNTVPPAVAYYVTGDVSLSGSGSTPQRTLSVIATGNIKTAGNVKLTPALTGTLLLAGRDIALAGTAGAQFQGVIGAHEQIKTTGNFSHIGVLLAKDAEDVSSLVTTGTAVGNADTDFGGSISVHYDGGLQTVIPNPNNSVTIKNVRRIR